MKREKGKISGDRVSTIVCSFHKREKEEEGKEERRTNKN